MNRVLSIAAFLIASAALALAVVAWTDDGDPPKAISAAPTVAPLCEVYKQLEARLAEYILTPEARPAGRDGGEYLGLAEKFIEARNHACR